MTVTGNVQNVQIRFDAPHGTTLTSQRRFQVWLTTAIRKRSDLRLIATHHKGDSIFVKFEVAAPENWKREDQARSVANMLMAGAENAWPGLVAARAALV